jgi:2-polyprenyl-6-hydroxyphenyl methylase/3-demethylubiquinone-9 3-methyltransferase
MANKENLSREEMEKFSSYGDQWWDPHSITSPLHRINPLRLSFIQQHSPAPLSTNRIIDIGCGGGILAEALAKAGAHVLGMDACESAIAAAKKHAASQDLPLTYTVSTIEALAQQPEHRGAYDIVTCMEMLEHVPHPDQVIAHAAALLKPNGLLFASTLNRTPQSFLFGIIGAEYVLGMIPKGTHSYQSFIKPSELRRWAERADLHYQAITGIHYNPFTDVFSLQQDIRVNYLCVFQKTS